MTEFVRFRVSDSEAFAALQAVFFEVKHIKNLDYDDEGDTETARDHDLVKLRELMPARVQQNFDWPEGDSLEAARLPPDKPIRIAPPGTYLGQRWLFVRVLDLIDTCDFRMESCSLTGPDTAEIHVDAQGYPYGGLNAIIALVEGFGFQVIGFNEWGEYIRVSEAPE